MIEWDMAAEEIPKFETEEFQALVQGMLPATEHKKRKESIANAVLGLVHCYELTVLRMGAALAGVKDLIPKHATKQIDRLLSNKKWQLTRYWWVWIYHQMAGTTEAIVALDWTDFDKDDHTTLALALVGPMGRGIPLMWKTVQKSTLKTKRNFYEDTLVAQFAQMVPTGCRVTVTADRGFADQKLFAQLETLGLDYVIRIKGSTYVSDDPNTMKPAAKWLPANGRTKTLKAPMLTKKFAPIKRFVATKKKDMKEAWYLASSRDDWNGPKTVKVYSRRFSIEEMFRDDKDRRFGLGLSYTRIRSEQRRDKLLFIAALARDIITALGAAGEACGFDRELRTNTVKRRTHSWYRQGQHYYVAMQRWKPKKRQKILEFFEAALQKSQLYQELMDHFLQ